MEATRFGHYHFFCSFNEGMHVQFTQENKKVCKPYGDPVVLGSSIFPDTTASPVFL